MKKQQKSVIMENRQEKNMVFVSFRIYDFGCFKTIMITKKSAINISCGISQPSYDNNFMFDQACRNF